METQQVVTGDAASLRRHAVAAVGMVLYCLGLLAAAMHVAAHIGLPLRLAGLAEAIGKPSLNGWVEAGERHWGDYRRWVVFLATNFVRTLGAKNPQCPNPKSQ